MWSFERTSRTKVADTALADQLHRATETSLHKYRERVAELPHWEALRRRARQVKLHTLTHLDQYLRQFVAAAEANGATVSWADTGADACAEIVELACREKVRRVVKAKSMTGEEIELNEALTRAGVEPVETDFGEMVCQLAGQRPSHVTAPIIQWSLEQVARLLYERGMLDALPAELGDAATAAALGPEERSRVAARLVAAARRALRPKFLSAELGFSGANFAVAESGTLVLVENEANLRLSTASPPIHVAVVGIDKLIPRLEDLATFLTLLPVAATGQRQSAYVSLLHRPHQRLHIILLDNGRSTLLADAEHYDLLSCIRCGACLNVCPVYRHVSGHGYASVYPGPIGATLTPHLWPEEHYRQLPWASSLCGACAEICPVRIPLDERLLQWRDRLVRGRRRPARERLAFAAWAWLMRHPALYRAIRPPAGWRQALAGRLGPVRRWRSTRELPAAAEETFADWWRKHHATREDRPADPAAD